MWNYPHFFSEYAEKLPFDIQARYLDKIAVINSDPYKVVTGKYEAQENNLESIPNMSDLNLLKRWVNIPTNN